MSPDDVTRAEIYEALLRVRGDVAAAVWAVGVLAVLVVIQVGVKVWESRRVQRVGRRVEDQLDLAARHGAITDAQRLRTDAALAANEAVLTQVRDVLVRLEVRSEATAAATATVTAAVDAVPDRTASKVVEKLHGDGSRHDLPAQGGGS